MNRANNVLIKIKIINFETIQIKFLNYQRLRII